jgi:hypothetical protein
MRTTVCSVKASGRSVRVSVPGVSVYGQSWPSTLSARVCSSSPSRTSGWPGRAALRRMASVALTVVPLASISKSRSTVSIQKAGGV